MPSGINYSTSLMIRWQLELLNLVRSLFKAVVKTKNIVQCCGRCRKRYLVASPIAYMLSMRLLFQSDKRKCFPRKVHTTGRFLGHWWAISRYICRVWVFRANMGNQHWNFAYQYTHKQPSECSQKLLLGHAAISRQQIQRSSWGTGIQLLTLHWPPIMMYVESCLGHEFLAAGTGDV